MPKPYYSTETHLACTPEAGHTCQVPSGRVCCEAGCREMAGTMWGPYWCPDHDAERIDRISGQLTALTEHTNGSHA
jgi:hypothetical protein